MDRVTLIDQELREAQRDFQNALDDALSLDMNLPWLLQIRSDGIQLVRVANEIVSVARERYRQALRVYANYVRERSGPN
jgi:hypothetical protein